MTTGFETLDVLTVWRGEGQPDLLPSGFEFLWRGDRFRHRPGGVTDGMSSPWFTHSLPDADPRGWAFPAAVAHDGAYHRALEKYVQGDWVPWLFSKEDADMMFKELLEMLAVSELQRIEAIGFYCAVKEFGGAAWKEGGN